jgi:hypothetical protein
MAHLRVTLRTSICMPMYTSINANLLIGVSIVHIVPSGHIVYVESLKIPP